MMAEASTTFLLTKIDNFVTEELKLRGSLDERINALKSEHEMIREVLNGADGLRENDSQFGVWIKQLRSIYHEIEGVVGMYAYRKAEENSAPWYSRIIPKMRTGVISEKMDGIGRQLISLKDKKDKYPTSLSVHPPPTSAEHQAGIAPLFTPETEIVGVEGPRRELAYWVLDVEEAYRVMFVVGMAGSGKTALVKLLYEQVKADFDCHAWLPAYEFEQTEKLLIVLDNWNRYDWEFVKHAFPQNNISRVIITTRRGDIASLCRDPPVNIHTIQPLPFEKARELFRRKAFPESGRYPSVPGLREASESLLKKCEGLPLGIIEMGKHLSRKERSESVFKKLESNLQDELENELSSIRQVLLSGYHDLPYHLKRCFLYMSMFPEDQPVNRRMLIRLWIAEDFIEGRSQNEPEDIGEGYLKELIQRNLVQESKLEVDGRPRTCRLHNFMHKIVLSSSHQASV